VINQGGKTVPHIMRAATVVPRLDLTDLTTAKVIRRFHRRLGQSSATSISSQQSGYRGLERSVSVWLAVMPARRKASASAPPDVGSFLFSGGVRVWSSVRVVAARTPPGLRPTSSSRRSVNPIGFRGFFDPHDVARLHDRARILHESLRHRRDMDQGILVNPDVDECAERCHVGHHALQDHSGREITGSGPLP
jgi:hypothetical protein